jgi:hypothetical protein
MPARDTSHALDHIVVVLFENRSLDNVLGHLYGPDDGKNFDGVIGKNLSNPIPPWAEHRAVRKTVPYTVATDIDSPNPDFGEAEAVEGLLRLLGTDPVLPEGRRPGRGERQRGDCELRQLARRRWRDRGRRVRLPAGRQPSCCQPREPLGVLRATHRVRRRDRPTECHGRGESR